MKKLISFMLVITMILGTITMTNVFADDAEETLAIDNHLIFDLDLSEYDSQGLKNVAPAEDGSNPTNFTKVQNVKVEQLDLGGKDPLYYLDTSFDGAVVEFIDADVNASADLTIEAWVYPNRVPTESDHMFMHGKKDGQEGGLWMFQVLADGVGNWMLYDQTHVKDADGKYKRIVQSFSVREWHHVVYVIDRGTHDGEKTKITAYVDGVNSGTVESSQAVPFNSTATTDVPFRISGGGWSTGTMNFDGRFGDVKIYTGVITDDEVEKKYEKELPDYTEIREDIKLVFDLGFENDADDTIITAEKLKNEAPEESADQALEFTYVSGMTMGSENINGQKVSYLDATEADDGIDVVSDAINNSPDITVEAWVKDDSVQGHMFLYGNKTDGWQLEVGASGDEWYANSTNAASVAIRNDFASDTTKWRHLVITLDRSEIVGTRTITVYVDGQRINSVTDDFGSVYLPNADGEDTPFRISGGSYSTPQGCDTKFADVKLYTGVMTEAEAMEHYIDDQYKYTEKKMVFDLGFSEDNSIVNKVEGSTAKITVNNVTNNLVNTTGGTFDKYLQPVDSEKIYNGSIKVEDDAIMGNGEITIESWMRWNPDRKPEETSYFNGHLAMLTKGVTGKHSLQLRDIASNDFRADLLSDTSKTVSMNMNMNEWIHYVATRKYDVDNKEVTMTIYVNGEKLGETTKEIDDIITSFMDKKGKNNYWLEIGSYNNLAICGFNGDIGTFKVYNYALTQDETYAKYLADTIDGICVCNPDFLNGAGEKIDNLTSETDKVTAKYKIYNFTVDSVNPRIAVLGYYENNVLQKVKIDTTTEFGTIESGATSPEYTITINDITPTAGSYVKLFVWDDFENIARVVGVNEGDMKLTYTESPVID